jgi:hypothetical protein
MPIYLFHIPDDTTQLARWLDRHIAGPHLGELAAELAAAHAAARQSEAPSASPSLHDLLGNALPHILARGVEALTGDQLCELLRHPQLLLQLQERVLIDGGAYWQRLLKESPELEAMLERGRRRILDRLLAGAPGRAGATDDQPVAALQAGGLSSGSPGQRAGRVLGLATGTVPIVWYRRPLAVSVMTAAAVVLLMLGAQYWLARWQTAPPAAWGWNSPDAMRRAVSSRGYFEALARAGEAWFNKRPADAMELAQRILQMRQGCNRLILADHPPLSPGERQWLKEKCRAWAQKFDEQLAALEAGEDPVAVRRAMDEIVRNLVTALRAGPPV